MGPASRCDRDVCVSPCTGLPLVSPSGLGVMELMPSDYLKSSLTSTSEMFLSSYGSNESLMPIDPISNQIRIQSKMSSTYKGISSTGKQKKNTESIENIPTAPTAPLSIKDQVDHLTDDFQKSSTVGTSSTVAIRPTAPRTDNLLMRSRNRPRAEVMPTWHAPWKLMRVISGHLGWVRCASVDVSNEWFVTGSADRTVKIWDLASGQLKLTLTGHIHTVRGVAVSARHPYLFSVGEDKMVKNWDLETNRVIRSYHGHLSGVYACALHPTLDVLVTGSRDSTARVWDMRTKAQVHVLSGHSHTVASVKCQATDPQVITGSHDSTIRQWDLASGRTQAVLTNHKKSIRALALHPSEYTYVSGAADNIKIWQCPKGTFLRNVTGHNTIVNAINVNNENVLVSGGDDGTLKFFDWKSGYNFQTIQSVVQPGSLDAEAAIYAIEWDQTGTRMITCEADKTIKIWRQDPDATEESHPIDLDVMKAGAARRDMY